MNKDDMAISKHKSDEPKGFAAAIRYCVAQFYVLLAADPTALLRARQLERLAREKGRVPRLVETPGVSAPVDFEDSYRSLMERLGHAGAALPPEPPARGRGRPSDEDAYVKVRG